MLIERRNVMRFAEASSVGRRGEERIAVRHRGRVRLLETDEIEWIEASSNYVMLHVGSLEFTVRATMPEMLERLGTDRFVRIHRSTIVNVRKIVELRPKGHGDYDVVLRSGAVVTLSRSLRHELFNGS
jgi:two-component system LytT family response regulator